MGLSCDFCQAICFGMSNFRARIKTRDLLEVSLNLQPLSGCQDDQTSADAHVEGGGAKKMARLNFCDKTSFL